METTNSDATDQDGDPSLDEEPADDINNGGDAHVDEYPLGDAHSECWEE